MILEHMGYEQTSESSKTRREESEISEPSRAYEASYGSNRNSANSIYTGLRANPAHLHPMRQGGQTLNTYKHLETNRERTSKRKDISEISKAGRLNYESGAISNTQNYTEQRTDPDHPHPMRQGGHIPNSYNTEITNRLNMEHRGEVHCADTCSNRQDSQVSNYWSALMTEEAEPVTSGIEEEIHFKSKKAPEARGHILHSWDLLLDMGGQGLRITLTQIIKGTCMSQVVSSLSFGSRGGKSTDLDIITNLGENYYIDCGRGVTIARRCMKQRFRELGFTKVVSSGRAIYINTLVTVGSSQSILTTRVNEHAAKRKKRRKTSKQRAASKAQQRLTAMGIIVGGMGADSNEEEAEAQDEPDTELTEKEKLGKLITLYKWRFAQFNISDAKRGGGNKCL